MSVYGSIIILAVTLIRVLGLQRFPKKMFVILWAVAVFRLLVPIQLSSPLSIYNMLDVPEDIELNAPVSEEAQQTGGPAYTISDALGANEQNSIKSNKITYKLSPEILWMLGVIICVGYFFIKNVQARRIYNSSLPLTDLSNNFMWDYAKEQEIRRPVTIRYSDKISSPLTYGLFRPKILLPKDMDWDDNDNIRFVIAHECQHIRSFDVVKKLMLLVVLCVHWFNPLVWLMFALANRDIELACDETVVKKIGERYKADYARALLTMEEWRTIRYPLASSFSKNLVKERIIHIMKFRKLGAISVALAAVIIAGTITVFATSSNNKVDATVENNETVQTQKTYLYWSAEVDGEPISTDEDGNIIDAQYILERFGQYGLIYDYDRGCFVYGDEAVGIIYESNNGVNERTYLVFGDGIDVEGLLEGSVTGEDIAEDSNIDYKEYVFLTDENGDSHLMNRDEYLEKYYEVPPMADEDIELMLSMYGEFGLTYDYELNYFMFDSLPVAEIHKQTGENSGETFCFVMDRDGICLEAQVDENYNVIGLEKL